MRKEQGKCFRTQIPKKFETKYAITSLLECEGNFLILSFSNFQMYDSDPTDYYFGLRTFRLLLFFIPRSFIMILLSLGKDRSFKTYKIMANY